jgi:hypothetical protein
MPWCTRITDAEAMKRDLKTIMAIVAMTTIAFASFALSSVISDSITEHYGISLYASSSKNWIQNLTAWILDIPICMKTCS